MRFKYMILLLFITLGCNTNQRGIQPSSQLATSRSTDSIVTPESIIGTWDMSINTRRGVKKSVLTIYEEDGQLKGKTERTNFVITQNDNKLTWASKIDSPMGQLDAVYEVIVKGTTMSGVISTKKRTLDLTGEKRL